MRVYGIARQSRGDDGSKSVLEQEERLRNWARREGHDLVGITAEQDVSGGRPLEKRPGLRAALDAVESGEADLVVAVYFDRLFRSLEVQHKFVHLVEKAGAKVEAMDIGEITHASVTKKLTANFLGAVAEYVRDTASERVTAAQTVRRSQGKWIGGKVPIGLKPVACDDGGFRLQANEDAAAVVEAYRMRESGKSFEEVRAYLRRATSLELKSLNIVQRMLRNPGYVSHGIVPGDLYRRVQTRSYSRGRRPPSDRLLARLGVLRCAICSSRMVVATATGSQKQRVPVYRCPPGNDCMNKQSITARIAEKTVIEGVKEILANMKGTASFDENVAEVEHELERAEQELDAAVRAFSVLDDVEVARERLAELRDVRDRARDRVAEARAAQGPMLTVNATDDWDQLSREKQRALIRAVIERVDVCPGRGPERVVIYSRL